jgi:hypothetical protein
MDQLIEGIGRGPRHRTTLYRTPPAERIERSYAAAPLAENIYRPASAFRTKNGDGLLIR